MIPNTEKMASRSTHRRVLVSISKPPLAMTTGNRMLIISLRYVALSTLKSRTLITWTYRNTLRHLNHNVTLLVLSLAVARLLQEAQLPPAVSIQLFQQAHPLHHLRQQCLLPLHRLHQAHHQSLLLPSLRPPRQQLSQANVRTTTTDVWALIGDMEWCKEIAL